MACVWLLIGCKKKVAFWFYNRMAVVLSEQQTTCNALNMSLVFELCFITVVEHGQDGAEAQEGASL